MKRIRVHAINAIAFIAIAIFLCLQVDWKGQQLIHQWYGLKLTVIACTAMFAWNLILAMVLCNKVRIGAVSRSNPNL